MNRNLTRSRDRIRCASLTLLMVCFAGCGTQNATQPVPVSGTITMDGQPLADADVYFVSGDLTAFARTTGDGNYTLAQGALPGMNRVFVTKDTEGDPSRFVPGYGGEGLDDGQLHAAIAAMGADTTMAVSTLPRSLIPPEFSSSEETRLSFLVPESGTRTASFQLTSK